MSVNARFTKKLKDYVLDIEFSTDGEPLGILGASGSGKSMTLKCIAGVETPDEGFIEVNGRTLFCSKSKINLPPQKRNVGYLFQNYALFPHMTLGQNIECVIQVKRSNDKTDIDNLLDRFGLTGLRDSYPARLSGGQQQRAALARIIAYEPELLMLDEPFAALDAHLRETLLFDIAPLMNEYGGNAILVAHDRREIYKLCPTLMALNCGKVSEFGKTKELFERPASYTAARLTGHSNFSRATKLSANTVMAHDWGRELEVTAPIPDDIAYIGIHSRGFVPLYDESADRTNGKNVISVRLMECIENPLEWQMRLETKIESIAMDDAGANTGFNKLWYACDKKHSSNAVPSFLYAPPENIIMLLDK